VAVTEVTNVTEVAEVMDDERSRETHRSRGSYQSVDIGKVGGGVYAINMLFYFHLNCFMRVINFSTSSVAAAIKISRDPDQCAEHGHQDCRVKIHLSMHLTGMEVSLFLSLSHEHFNVE
jgi:hypothetical protein